MSWAWGRASRCQPGSFPPHRVSSFQCLGSIAEAWARSAGVRAPELPLGLAPDTYSIEEKMLFYHNIAVFNLDKMTRKAFINIRVIGLLYFPLAKDVYTRGIMLTWDNNIRNDPNTINSLLMNDHSASDAVAR